MNKKDPDYVASVEKAIKKKYGTEAIENPSKHWGPEKEKKYLQDLKDFVQKQKKHEQDHTMENVHGVLVSHKLLNKEAVCTCLQCNERLRTLDDEVYFAKFEACFNCYIQYIEGREQRWLDGWRPKNVTRSS